MDSRKTNPGFFHPSEFQDLCWKYKNANTEVYTYVEYQVQLPGNTSYKYRYFFTANYANYTPFSAPCVRRQNKNQPLKTVQFLSVGFNLRLLLLSHEQGRYCTQEKNKTSHLLRASRRNQTARWTSHHHHHHYHPHLRLLAACVYVWCFERPDCPHRRPHKNIAHT